MWRVDEGTAQVMSPRVSVPNMYAFAPDMSKVVMAWSEGPAEIWRTDGTEEPMILSGGREPVAHVVFSPNGSRVAVVSSDDSVRVWRSDGTGEPVVRRGDGSGLERAVFSPDGAALLTIAGSATLMVHSLDSVDRSVVLLPGVEGRVLFSPSGRYVLGDGLTSGVRVWRADGGGDSIEVWGERMDPSPDGRRLLLWANKDARLLLTDEPSRQVELVGHKGRISYHAFSPDGTSVITGDVLGGVIVWNMENGMPLVLSEPQIESGDEQTLEGAKATVVSLAFSPDAQRVVAGFVGGSAVVGRADGKGDAVELEASREIYSFRSAAFSPDSKRVLTTAEGAVLWWADDKRHEIEFAGYVDGVEAAGFAADGRHLWTLDGAKAVRIWRTDESVLPLPEQWDYQTIAISDDWRQIVTIDENGWTRLWRAGERVPVVLRGPGAVAGSVAFSADGGRIITDSEDSTATIRRVDGDGDPVVLRGHEGPVRSVMFSKDGSRVITGSEDGTARVWQADGRLLTSMRDPGKVLTAAFSADGSRVVTGSQDGTGRVRRVDGGDEVVVLKGEEPVILASFSPDGERVLLVTQNATTSLCRAWVRAADGSGEQVALQGGYIGIVSVATFSPDGGRVVVLTKDIGVWVWQDLGGEPVRLRPSVTSAPISMALSVDGRSIAAVGFRGDVNIWPLCSPEECVEELWRATSYCLSAEQRSVRLGESDADAAANAAKCRARVDGLMAQGVYR